MMRRFILAGLAVISLSACDTWFGENEAPPLPGERISVLLHDRSIKPDPELDNHEILLPPPCEKPRLVSSWWVCQSCHAPYRSG